MTRIPASLPAVPARRRLFAGVLAAMLLGGCSPAYDWREVQGAEDAYVVMLPARPARLTRQISLDGLEVSMTMQGARVGEVAFTVGEAALPDDSPATREKAIDAMRAGMLRNIGANQETPVQALAVPVVDAARRTVGTEAGWRIEAGGQANGQPVQMLALFTARGARAWQVVVIGPSPDREQARQFFDGFRLRGQARAVQ